MLEVGTVLAGKYRIEQIIGRGGMGMVAIATHLQLDQRVALKVVLENLSDDEAILERFLREARASAKLKSEHVCRVSDVDRLPSGQPYIVMELLSGSDLAHVGTLSPSVAAEYVMQACVAIAEAHALGIVHRDLKPANLFLTHRLDGAPLIKVLDFGIAKAIDQAELRLTSTQALMGSPGYMSPEQLRSARDVDARSDLWALGVILYELTTGTLPFIGQTITELAVKVAIDPPRPLPAGFDPHLAGVIARCLEKDVDKRYQSVSELASELAPNSAAATLIARLSGTQAKVSAPRTVQATVMTQVPSTAPPPVKQRSKAPFLAGALVVLVGGVAAFALTRSGDEEKKPVHHEVPHDAAIAIDAPIDAPADAAIDAAIPVDAAVVHKVATKPEPEPPAKKLSPLDVARAVHEGDEALRAEQWQKAIDAEKPVLAMGLDHPQAARVAAIAHCRLGHGAAAQRLFEHIKQPKLRQQVIDACATKRITLE